MRHVDDRRAGLRDAKAHLRQGYEHRPIRIHLRRRSATTVVHTAPQRRLHVPAGRADADSRTHHEGRAAQRWVRNNVRLVPMQILHAAPRVDRKLKGPHLIEGHAGNVENLMQRTERA